MRRFRLPITIESRFAFASLTTRSGISGASIASRLSAVRRSSLTSMRCTTVSPEIQSSDLLLALPWGDLGLIEKSECSPSSDDDMPLSRASTVARLERRASFEITRVEGKRELSQPCTARLAPTIGISQYEGYPGTERNP